MGPRSTEGRAVQWRSSDYSLSLTRTRVLPPRGRNELRERTEGRRSEEGRRSSVDSIIVGSAPRFTPCKHPRQRGRTRRVKSCSRPSGYYRILGTERSLFACVKSLNGGTFCAGNFFLSLITWKARIINYKLRI